MNKPDWEQRTKEFDKLLQEYEQAVANYVSGVGSFMYDKELLEHKMRSKRDELNTFFYMCFCTQMGLK